jgi:hypothetical protein
VGDAMRHSLITYYAIVNKADVGKMGLTYTCDEDPFTKKRVSLKFKVDTAKQIQNGNLLFKLAAKAHIKDLTDDKAKLKISLDYQVLSTVTALLGVVKQDQKLTGEVKNIEFNKKKV